MSTSEQFGQSLRDARVRRGLTVEQLASETTIPVAHIEALEAGAVDALPRAMYRRAEARAYAEAVGLDPDVILSALRQTTVAPHVAADSRPAAGDLLPAAHEPAVAAAPARLPEMRMPGALSPDPRVTSQPQGHIGARFGRAILVLVCGCAAMWWEQATAPELPVTSLMTLSQVDPVAMIEDAVRIAEPPPAAPSMRRVLYEPRIAANGGRWPRDARLDEGVLVVHSSPRGARVTVNGVGWGLTPVAIRYLPMGTLRVRVGKAEYGAREQIVELTPQHPSRTLQVTLPQVRRRAAAPSATAAAALVVTSVPEGARVTVNGIGWGTTPLSIAHLPAGIQRVRLVKEQFRSEERVVTVAEGQPGRVTVTLKPQS